MGKKTKGLKKMDLKVAPWQEGIVTEQASLWPAMENLATSADSPHELDPDGNVVLILKSSSSNEGITWSNRRKLHLF